MAESFERRGVLLPASLTEYQSVDSRSKPAKDGQIREASVPVVCQILQMKGGRLARRHGQIIPRGEPRCAIPVAIALRQSLIEIASVRQTNLGQSTKMGMVYEYLTGPRFRAHVESIVEKFAEMEQDLARERKTMIRLWAKREEQIRGVIESTAGMYGDLQGIAGKGLNEIEGLQVSMLPSGGEGESSS
jgi:hypothetical protein